MAPLVESVAPRSWLVYSYHEPVSVSAPRCPREPRFRFPALPVRSKMASLYSSEVLAFSFRQNEEFESKSEWPRRERGSSDNDSDRDCYQDG